MANQKCARTLTVWYLGTALALCSIGLSGCEGDDGPALSVQPFYAPADLDDDPGLAGAWTDKEGDFTFIFEPGDEQTYKLVVEEKDGERVSRANFEAHLMNLGPHRFLDFLPVSSAQENVFFQMHLVPAHSLARVELSQDKLELAFLDGEWLQKKIDEKTVDVPYQKTSGAPLLTGTTDEIQDLVLLNLDEKEMFSDLLPMTRKEEQQ